MSRNGLLALVHAGAKALGLDETARRALQVRLTEKSSCAEMTAAELHRIIGELKRLGFKPAPKRSPRGGSDTPPRGKLGAKLEALWLAGWHLGVVRNPSGDALASFIKRQTGLDAARFAHASRDAARAIEGLKAWLAREAGVDWSVYRGGEDNPRARVLEAQWRMLRALGALGEDEGAPPPFHRLNPEHARSLMETMGARIRALRGAAA